VQAFLLMATIAAGPISHAADEMHQPSDRIASIDGHPIYLGELNLILAQRLGPENLKQATPEIRRAAAVILIRRHLAMRTMREQGGETLERLIGKDLADFRKLMKQRGTGLQEYAEARGADEASLVADLAWQTGWRTYLQSRMTDANLRNYFTRQHVRYDGTRWNVSQIFFATGGQDETRWASALDRMERLVDEIRSANSITGAFAQSAREHSEAGSASQGGLIGWVQKVGDLPEPVMRAIEKTNVGQISAAVRSPLGIHLLLINAKEPGKMTFDDLVDHSQIRRDAADALFDSLVKQQQDTDVVWHIESLRAPTRLP
tara:strand:+ start:245780 stop:246733 length:954 start_codon:yes stop_codon:yes gene_type:complete